MLARTARPAGLAMLCCLFILAWLVCGFRSIRRRMKFPQRA
jgi:hypothetical protein